MLWVIIRTAALVAALMSSARAEEGMATQYGSAGGLRWVAQRERAYGSAQIVAVRLTGPRHQQK